MTSTFWDGTQSFSGVEKAIIPHMKEGIQGFHISPNTAIVVCNFIEIIASPYLKWIAPRICSGFGTHDQCRSQKFQKTVRYLSEICQKTVSYKNVSENSLKCVRIL